MKEKLLTTVKELRENGINIKETPPLFKWTYPEEPEIVFQLLITEGKDVEVEAYNNTQH